MAGFYSGVDTLPRAPVAIQTPMGSFTSNFVSVSRRTRHFINVPTYGGKILNVTPKCL